MNVQDMTPAAPHALGNRFLTPGQTAIGILLLVLTGIGGSRASGIQDLQAIRDTAARFAATGLAGTGADKPTIKVASLDPRLRLPACNVPLQAFAAPGGRKTGNIVIGVRCRGASNWSLYVPVSIALMRKVVVLDTALPRGSLLQDTDIRMERHDVYRLHSGFFTDPAQVIGMTLHHSLPAGRILSRTSLKAAKIIRRGARVTLIAQTGGIAVRMSGKALMNGAAGERIRVRNLKSKRIVEGIVRDMHTVTVNL